MLAKSTGCELDRAGRVVVQPDLTIEGHPEIFVAGDLAAIAREKSDPQSIAMRLAPALLYGQDHVYAKPGTGTDEEPGFTGIGVRPWQLATAGQPSSGSGALASAYRWLTETPVFILLWFLWFLCWLVAIFAPANNMAVDVTL